MTNWRDELAELLREHEYDSQSLPGSKRQLMEHHIEALLEDLVPFIEDHFDPDGRAEFSVTDEGEEALSAEEEATEIFGPGGGDGAS